MTGSYTGNNMPRFQGTPIDQTTQQQPEQNAESRFGGTPVMSYEQVLDQEQQKALSQSVRAEEAPFMAQMGRGMLDIYQGGKQELLTTGATARPAVDQLVKKTDQAIDNIFTPGSMMNKFAKSLFSSQVDLAPASEVKRKAEQYNKELSGELALYNQNNPDFQIGRLLGNVATPLTLVPGAGPRTLGGRIVAGSATGTLFSQFQPVDNPDNNPDEYYAQKAEQALWGASTGGLLPVAGSIFNVTKNWINELTKPFSDKGVFKDVGKFLNDHLTENKDRIINSLKDAIKNGDKRTVGQIIADANKGVGIDFGGKLARLEKDISRYSDSLKSLYARQSASRRQFFDRLTGTDDDLAKAMATREANGADLYQKAFQHKIQLDPDIASILDNDYGRKAIREAVRVAEAKGVPRTNNSEILHYVKLGLDKELSKTGDLALSKAERGAVADIKSKMVNWLENKNPFYKDARIQYQTDSLPIDRMMIARELKNKLVNSLDQDSPSAYANALRDSHKIIKKTGGDPRFTSLEDIFSPEEVGRMRSIADELATDAKASKMASASASAFKDLKGEIEVQLPHILERNIVVTNAILKRIGMDKTPEYQKMLANLVANPEEFIRAYGGSGSNEKTKIAMDIVRRLNTLAISQEGSREIGQ